MTGEEKASTERMVPTRGLFLAPLGIYLVLEHHSSGVGDVRVLFDGDSWARHGVPVRAVDVPIFCHANLQRPRLRTALDSRSTTTVEGNGGASR